MPSPYSAITAAALLVTGGVGGAAIGSRSDPKPAPATPARRAGPVEVRTVVVHRTVREVRHVKPKRPRAPHGAAAPAVAPAASAAPSAVVAPGRSAPLSTRSSATAGPAPRATRPLTTRSSTTSPAKKSTKPLSTRSSATGGGEHEHEGGRDD
ncbi:MAG: hypothetical protein ACXVSX_04800 [Solirubrobacteraceae bacterium]